MSVNAAPDSDPGLLGIYLNDHLAGATGGLELFRRAAGSHEDTVAGPVLDRLTAETESDRDPERAVAADPVLAELKADAEAYDLYLRGRYCWFRRGMLKRSMGYFQRALEADPEYALAYHGLGDDYQHRGCHCR